MDSSRLSAEQVNKLRVELERQSDYLHRLVYRMADLNWRKDDPLLVSALQACAAVDTLLAQCVVRRRPGGRLP